MIRGSAVRLASALLAITVSLALIGCGSSASATGTRAGASAAPARRTSGAGAPARTSAAVGKPTLHTYWISSGGVWRKYLLQVPADPKGAMPLMMVLHGAGDTALNTYQTTDYAKVAAADGDLVAFPQGYDSTWNEGAGDTPARQLGINDVAFIAAMIRQIESRYAVVRAKVVAAGVSNGAFMVEYLGCQLAATISLIEPVEGQLPTSVAAGCHPARPISVLEIHGTSDGQVPYGGGRFHGVGGGTTVLSAPESAARWAGLDGCGAHPVASTSGARTVTSYSGCRSGTHVELLTIHGGTHRFPDDAGVLLAQGISALG